MVKEHDIAVASVGHMANGKLQTKAVVGDLIKVPFLQAPRGGVYTGRIIDPAAIQRKTRNRAALGREDVFTRLEMM
jgi:hypothetical protein